MAEKIQEAQRIPMTYNEKKWTVLFRYFDVNRDKILHYDEYMEFPNRLLQQGKEEHGQLLKSLYDLAWKRLCEINNLITDTSSLLENQFVYGSEVLRTKDEWFVSTFVPTIASIYFDSLDENQDGYISVKEWRIYQNNRGVNDEKVIQATFNRLDKDGDGRVSREEMRHAVTQFNLGEDPSDDYSFLYDPKKINV